MDSSSGRSGRSGVLENLLTENRNLDGEAKRQLINTLIEDGWRILAISRDPNCKDKIAQVDAFRWKFTVMRVLGQEYPNCRGSFAELTSRSLLNPRRFAEAVRFLEQVCH